VRDFVQPQNVVEAPTLRLPHPWGKLRWGEGGTAILSGQEGIGKSSIALLLNAGVDEGAVELVQPGADEEAVAAALLTAAHDNTEISAYFALEMEPALIASTAKRLGVACPPVYPLFGAAMTGPDEGYAALKQALARWVGKPGTFGVFDSITMLQQHALPALNLIIADTAKTLRRSLALAQNNKGGEVFGVAALRYNPSIVGNIVRDSVGRARFSVTKNRFGTEFSTYYRIDRQSGRIVPITAFGRIAHSVEGSYPTVNLVPHGRASGSSRNDAGLNLLGEFGLLPEFAGYASAAYATKGTYLGIAEPEDVDYRRGFAEDHGFTWLGVDEIADALRGAFFLTDAGAPDWKKLRKHRKREEDEGDGAGGGGGGGAYHGDSGAPHADAAPDEWAITAPEDPEARPWDR